MPTQVSFYMKDGSTEGMNNNKRYIYIDEQMCKALNQPIDDDKFLVYWVDTIGLAVACGNTLLEAVQKEIRGLYSKHATPDTHSNQLLRIKVAQWLLENTTTDAYYTPR